MDNYIDTFKQIYGHILPIKICFEHKIDWKRTEISPLNGNFQRPFNTLSHHFSDWFLDWIEFYAYKETTYQIWRLYDNFAQTDQFWLLGRWTNWKPWDGHFEGSESNQNVDGPVHYVLNAGISKVQVWYTNDIHHSIRFEKRKIIYQSHFCITLELFL